jgi:hypothetical protein
MALNSVSQMLSKGQVAVKVQLSKLGPTKKSVFCLWANGNTRPLATGVR